MQVSLDGGNFNQQPRETPEVGTSLVGRCFDRYHGYLTLLVRADLAERLRRKIDPTDIVQETFLEAHRQATQFRGTTEAQVLAWLKRILAGQLALTWRRYLGTKGRDIRLEREMAANLDYSARSLDRRLAAARLNPSHAAMRREEAVMLAAALQRGCRAIIAEVMILRHVGGVVAVGNRGAAEAAQRMRCRNWRATRPWNCAHQLKHAI